MAADLTTADVYEDASLIGQDIERVIERFGHDAVIDLMPKIISVLEKLELVVAEKEKNRLEIAELKLENERLYTEIKREASQRRRLDEVSSGFDQYFIILCRNAPNLLLELRSIFFRCTFKLKKCLNFRAKTHYYNTPRQSHRVESAKPITFRHSNENRSKDLCIVMYCTKPLFQMEEQIDRLTTINESVRKSLGASQARISVLAKEKAELQTELRTLKRPATPIQEQEGQEEEIIEEKGVIYNDDNELQEQQDNANETEEVEDEETPQNSFEKTEVIVNFSEANPPPKPPRLKVELEATENNVEFHENHYNGIEGKDEQRKNKSDKNGNDEEHEDGDWEFLGEIEKPDFKREKSEEEQKVKAVVNHTRGEKEIKLDPNRPRYTKAEMLEVLIERNNLKERVFALEDELKIYKPR
ncbi:unnamed protein product [Porites evermanni]|uniref:RILP-like protein 1 n=1 Tax=Porites evermanni TaxID=104178 RepID=A0ABN8SJZ5_9CNID|nr:unnamed protein product [Porites evermanni]